LRGWSWGAARPIAVTARLTTVIARLDRAIQYAGTVMVNQQGRGVLDHPLSRMMTVE
jgi:hypothetical protein